MSYIRVKMRQNHNAIKFSSSLSLNWLQIRQAEKIKKKGLEQQNK